MSHIVPKTDAEREVFWQKVLDTIAAERALADHLAADLAEMADSAERLKDYANIAWGLPDVKSLARWREARSR